MSSAVALAQAEIPWQGTIGMCLSGGGFRAAAYHLGTLEYLERLGLLGNVRMVSVASGAAFTAATYALSLVEQVSFDDYFRDYYRKLRDTNLLEIAMEELVERGPDRPSGRENAVLAMADVFAREFFAHGDDSYRLGTLLDADIHLDELVFNAVEFRTAEMFRFQRSQSPKAVIGHAALTVPREDAAKIRIADIVATSVSIPIAFEPLAFPDDFSWPGGEVPEQTRAVFSDDEGEPRPVPLMDGGLHDNQGIESLLLADERDPDTLGLFLLSDVFRSRSDYYQMSRWRGLGGPPIGSLIPLAWMFAFVCGSTAIAIAVRAVQRLHAGSFDWVWDPVIYGVPLLMAGVVLTVLIWARQLVRYVLADLRERVPGATDRAKHFFKRVRLDQLVDMLELRGKSTEAASTSVVWKRVRDLGYLRVFDNPRYRGRRISSLITHLRPGERYAELPGVAAPSPAIQRAAEIAWRMPTILWFEFDEQLPCVVATAQATLCYNLMKFIVRRWGDDPGAYPAPVAEMWSRLVADWDTLSTDPHALVAERLPDDVPRPS